MTADIYPYINNGLGIAAFIHPRHFATRAAAACWSGWTIRPCGPKSDKEMETTSGWENWFRHVGHDWGKVVIGQTNDSTYAPLAGQSLAQMAKAKNEDPWDTVFQIGPGWRVCPARKHERGKQAAGHPRGIRFVLHRRRPVQLGDRFASAGLWLLSAAAVALRPRPRRDFARAGRRSGQRRRRERHHGV